MVQIDFYDKAVLKTLVPAKTLAPDTIYYFVDYKLRENSSPANVRQAILSWGKVKQLHIVYVDTTDVMDIEAKLQEVITSTSDNIYMDLNGGAEMLIACGYKMCDGEHVIPVYADIERGYIFNIQTKELLAKLKKITLNDYVYAMGAKQIGTSHSLPKEKDFWRITQVAEYLFDHNNHWHAMNHYISNNSSSDAMVVTVPETILYNGTKYRMHDILNVFLESGFLRHLKPNRYEFRDKQIKEYVRNFGIWLELYIYIKFKEVFDEIRLGVVLDWTKADGVDTSDNEIDVVAMKNSIPYFISCKMRKPVPQDVYEVGYLAKRLGGDVAKGVLATNYPVKSEGGGDRGIHERIRKMHVGLIQVGYTNEGALRMEFDNL